MFEREKEDSAFYESFIEILNILICEALPYENSVRRSLGQDELLSAPEVECMEDGVDMCEKICNVALPYGVASYFSSDDGEVYNSTVYRERFLGALRSAAKAVAGEVEDAYVEGI